MPLCRQSEPARKKKVINLFKIKPKSDCIDHALIDLEQQTMHT